MKIATISVYDAETGTGMSELFEVDELEDLGGVDFALLVHTPGSNEHARITFEMVREP